MRWGGEFDHEYVVEEQSFHMETLGRHVRHGRGDRGAQTSQCMCMCWG